MLSPDLFVWTRTNESLTELENLLKCQQCKKIFDNPQKYNGCGHLICKQCTAEQNKSICPVCNVPSCKSDITSDHVFNNIIAGYKLISNAVSHNRGNGNGSEEVTKNPMNICYSKNETDLVSIEQQNKNEANHKKYSSKVLRAARNSKKEEPDFALPEIRRTKTSDRRSAESQNKPNIKVIDLCDDDDGGGDSNQSNRKRSAKRTINIKRPSCEEEEDSKAVLSPSGIDTKPSVAKLYKTSQKKDIMKRNNKGETQLHVACIKGNKKRIEELLEAGANPCTKDNAGWTPLHEAVSKGFVDIAQLLLEAGAMVNAPGCYNNTPLHDAVINNHLEISKLLMTYGADPDICNIEGNSPRNLTDSGQMLTILKTKPLQKKSSEVSMKHITNGDIVLQGYNLDSEKQSKLTMLVQHFKLKQTAGYSSEVSHIVVGTSKNQCLPSVPVLHAILQGKWIVNSDWMDQCLSGKELVDAGCFEVKGTTNFPNSEGPRKGRLNAAKLLPSIFNGCHFYLASGNKFSVGELVFSKNELTSLIRSGGGVVLTREPNPEAIPPLECTVPYHAGGVGVLAKCSHYIIYQPGKGEPQLKYNMAHVKSLTVTWLLQCMETFSLVPP